MGASTDVNGYFSITRVPPGSYTLMSTYLGYDTASAQITVRAGAIISQKLFLNKSSIRLREIEVSAEKQEQLTSVKVSVETVTSKQITQIVSVGGEADIAQYLSVLPGVVFTGDQGGQLYIRGGSPVQNKVMLDGMIIYNPFHSIGLFSVFDTDIIKNADVYTGGYNANHGGRISAVMDITTRDGNQKRLSGKVGVSPFMGRMLLEGRWGRLKMKIHSHLLLLYRASLPISTDHRNTCIVMPIRTVCHFLSMIFMPKHLSNLRMAVS